MQICLVLFRVAYVSGLTQPWGRLEPLHFGEDETCQFRRGGCSGPGQETGPPVKNREICTSGSGAARLAAIPAGESPASIESSRCCSHIQRRQGRPTRRKPGSKAPDGWETGQIRARGASNLTGRSNVRTTEAAKDVPRVKRIAGDWECRAGQISAKAYVDTAA